MKNRIVIPDFIASEINKTYEIIKQGGVILYPTDTIWGIGCDACNAEAVEKIYKIKERSESKSMIVLLDEMHKLNLYVDEVPAMAWDWIEFSEKPLTVVYEGARNLAKNLINQEDGTIAIRVVKEDLFCKGLTRKMGKPLVSTSANKSGKTSPKSYKDIDKEILQAVDYIVNLRQNENIQTPPSSIVSISSKGVFKFIRK